MRSCVIISIFQDTYARIVGGYRIKIEDLNLFIIKNHFSLHLLPSVASPSEVKPTFISSSSKWVIVSRATDHMIGNSSLFTMFQSHPSTFIVTLADESTSCVLGSGKIHSTPLPTLTYVMSLPQLSYNLIFVSKLTHTLNCSISFFPDHCLIQDLSTKRIISR